MPTSRISAPPPTTTRRAALYLRVSTAGQVEREIPMAGQESSCREFAERHGWEVVQVYRDEGISGRTDQRPGFQAMVLGAKRREFNVLVVWEVSRLSRRAEHTLGYVAKLVHDYKVSVRAVTQDFILDNPVGQLILGVMASVAAFESDMIGERTRRGMRKSAQMGRRPGGTAPFGFRSEDARLVIRDDEAAVIRQVWRWRTEEHLTLAAIADRLNETGCRTRRGKLWAGPSIHQTICNPAVQGRTVTRFYDGEETEEIAQADTHPPILFPAEWARLGWKLAKADFNRVRRGAMNGAQPASHRSTHLLTGLLFYEATGAPLVARGSTSATGRTHHYYGPQQGTARRLRGDAVDRQVLEAVADATLTPEAILEGLTWYREQRRHRIATAADTLRELTGRREGLLAQIRRLTNELANGLASDAVRERLLELEAELAGVNAEVARVQVDVVGEESEVEDDPGRWQQFCSQVRANLMADPELQRAFLHLVVNRIDVPPEGPLTVHHTVLRPTQSAREPSDVLNWLPSPPLTRTFRLAA